MNYLSAHSPQWADAAHTTITLQVVFVGLGELPFCASPGDMEAHGRELFAKAVAGDFGVVAEYVVPDIPQVIPQVVSRAQGMAALHQQGYLSAVESYMATAPMIEQIAWNAASDFRRDSPTVQKLAGLLSIDSSGLDSLFTLAASFVF